MKVDIRTARILCRLPEGFDIVNEEQYLFAMRCWRERMVEARRTNNDQLAVSLSQCKEMFKRRYRSRVLRQCPKCGNHKNPMAKHCQPCSLTDRHYSHSLKMEEPKEYVIELVPTPIGPKGTSAGILTRTLREMAASGKVGDSFVTHKPPSTVNNVASQLGLRIICRLVNPGEKDPHKRKYRVWRSDGYDDAKVNEIIQKRMAGEEVPPPKPCIPKPKNTRKR